MTAHDGVGDEMPNNHELTAELGRLVAYLRKAWAAPLKAMTVPQAAERLGMPLFDEDRLNILSHLRQNPDLLGRYPALGVDPIAFVLTSEEKLVVRHLSHQLERTGNPPSMRSVASAVGMESGEAPRALRFLSQMGLLHKRPTAGSAPGHQLTDACHSALSRGVFYFHTVTVDARETFNVP